MSDEIDLRVVHPGDALSALLDGELTMADEAAVRRHLDGCGSCRAELDEVAAARQAVRGLPAVAPPAGFVGEVVDGRRRADRRGVAVTLVAAALALVVGLVAATRDAGAPAGSDDGSQQVALVDRPVRPFFPTPRGASPGPGFPRWDAGRPGPDVKLPSPARPDPSGDGDDEQSMPDRAPEADREMLGLTGGCACWMV